jgi:hypothetical protein
MISAYDPFFGGFTGPAVVGVVGAELPLPVAVLALDVTVLIGLVEVFELSPVADGRLGWPNVLDGMLIGC